MHPFLAAALLVLSLAAAPQEPPAASPAWADLPGLPPDYRAVEAERPDGSRARILVTDPGDGPGTQRPLLVYVEGSGAQSSFYRLPDGRIAGGLFALIAGAARDEYHVATVEKRGVEFGDMGAQRGTGEGASEEYTRHATLSERRDDVRLLLDTLLADPRFDDSHVLLVGHSEGADVVAAAAADDPRVSHVAFLSGGGAMQFFDMFVLRRRAMEAAGATPEAIEAAMEGLEEEIRAIMAAPDSETDFWQGHAYRRWSTFASTAAAEALAAAPAHLFLAHGSEDDSVPIESFDYLVARLLSAGRDDVTVRRFPGRDHSFIPVDSQPGYEGIMEVVEEVLEWARWVE